MGVNGGAAVLVGAGVDVGAEVSVGAGVLVALGKTTITATVGAGGSGLSRASRVCGQPVAMVMIPQATSPIAAVPKPISRQPMLRGNKPFSNRMGREYTIFAGRRHWVTAILSQLPGELFR